MLIERMLFNIIAFLLFVLVFFKMVRKNDSNIIAILIIQAIGIAISFLELMTGNLEWSFLKFLSYIISVALPLTFLYCDKNNVNILEKAHVIIAKLYLLTNNQSLSKKKLVSIVTRYPDSYMGHKMLADIYEKEGGMRKAIDEYVKAIDIKKNDYDSYYKIAELLNGLTKKDEAITMLNNLLNIKPDYIKASNLLGELLIEESRFKEATNVYLDALKYNPDNYDFYYNLGISYTMINDFKNARMAYEKAAEVNHLKYNSEYTLGQIALIYNDINIAEKHFTEAIYGEEVEAMAYYELAKVCMIKKDKEKAILFVEKAIEIDEIYEKKVAEDLIFVPIKAYIKRRARDEMPPRKKLTKKELDVKEHLENTYNVVEKLNDLDIKSNRLNYKEESKDKQR